MNDFSQQLNDIVQNLIRESFAECKTGEQQDKLIGDIMSSLCTLSITMEIFVLRNLVEKGRLDDNEAHNVLKQCMDPANTLKFAFERDKTNTFSQVDKIYHTLVSANNRFSPVRDEQ